MFSRLFTDRAPTINQIGIVAGVPRTKVYGVVRKLVERGLLEESEDDPKVFLAKSPKDVLIPLLEKEEKRIEQGIEALESSLKSFTNQWRL